MSTFSFIFSFSIIFALFGENHAALVACTPSLGPATGCGNDAVYSQAQCEAMFNTAPGGGLNTALCQSDEWVTQALHCAELCQVCCHRQQTGKNDPFLCGTTGVVGKLGAEADVKKKCDDAKKDRNLIVYMSLNSTCPGYCDPNF